MFGGGGALLPRYLLSSRFHTLDPSRLNNMSFTARLGSSGTVAALPNPRHRNLGHITPVVLCENVDVLCLRGGGPSQIWTLALSGLHVRPVTRSFLRDTLASCTSLVLHLTLQARELTWSSSLLHRRTDHIVP